MSKTVATKSVRRKPSNTGRLTQWLIPAMPWLVCAGAVLIWELACLIFSIPEFILPRPSQIAYVLVSSADAIWFHSRQTLFTTSVGFALSVVFGLLMGIAVGASRFIYRGFYPLLIGFNSVPKVALVPVLVVWFGIGTVPAILTAFLMSFFPIVVNVATGLATVEPELEDVLRSLGAKKRDLIFKVGLPRSLPFFFASLKVAVTLAFVGSVISESIASSVGIGTLMVRAASDFRISLVFAGLVVTAVMGVIMYAIFALLEHHTTGWAVRSNNAN
jgi:NitT/TauT family transport system permease protein